MQKIPFHEYSQARNLVFVGELYIKGREEKQRVPFGDCMVQAVHGYQGLWVSGGLLSKYPKSGEGLAGAGLMDCAPFEKKLAEMEIGMLTVCAGCNN